MRFLPFMFLVITLILPINGQDGDNPCADLGPNEICYGQETIELLVNCEAAPEFDTAGERIPLEDVCLIRSRDVGMALVHLQSDSDSALIAVLGDVEMQSVSSGQVGSEAVLNDDANIYNGPGSQYDIIGELEMGGKIFVNACNCTRNWLRIMQSDGSVGWIPARRVTIDDAELPEVTVDAPVYQMMQAFTLVTNGPDSGLLIQMQGDATLPLQINGVRLDLDSTAFVRAEPDQDMEIDVLDGEGHITVDTMTVQVPAGGHVLIPLSEQRIPSLNLHVELYEEAHTVDLPLDLLPRPVDPDSALDVTHPTIIGVENCNVVSDTGLMACPLHFLNPDGDAIVQMEVEFVYAAFGEWEGRVHESPELLDGDMSAGQLAWNISCSLAGENFIGPVEWLITLEDESGHRSDPYLAAFNCVDG